MAASWPKLKALAQISSLLADVFVDQFAFGLKAACSGTKQAGSATLELAAMTRWTGRSKEEAAHSAEIVLRAKRPARGHGALLVEPPNAGAEGGMASANISIVAAYFNAEMQALSRTCISAGRCLL